jgi:hypothetical protein
LVDFFFGPVPGESLFPSLAEAFLFDLIKSIRIEPFPYGKENVVESPLCSCEAMPAVFAPRQGS